MDDLFCKFINRYISNVIYDFVHEFVFPIQTSMHHVMRIMCVLLHSPVHASMNFIY